MINSYGLFEKYQNVKLKQKYAYFLIKYYNVLYDLLQDKNKKQLFEFLGDAVASKKLLDGKLLIATRNEQVCSATVLSSVHSLTPCSHEEADTRMFVHVKD